MKLRTDLEAENGIKIGEMKSKIQDAASTLLMLDRELLDERKKNEKLQLEISQYVEENKNLRECNASKFLQIQSILVNN